MKDDLPKKMGVYILVIVIVFTFIFTLSILNYSPAEEIPSGEPVIDKSSSGTISLALADRDKNKESSGTISLELEPRGG